MIKSNELSNTAFYAVGNIAPKLSGFILLPIYTKLITVADYGVLWMLEVIEILAVHILSAGIPQALLRLVLQTVKRKRKTYLYIFTFLVYLCICAQIIVILLKKYVCRISFR